MKTARESRPSYSCTSAPVQSFPVGGFETTARGVHAAVNGLTILGHSWLIRAARALFQIVGAAASRGGYASCNYQVCSSHSVGRRRRSVGTQPWHAVTARAVIFTARPPESRTESFRRGGTSGAMHHHGIRWKRAMTTSRRLRVGDADVVFAFSVVASADLLRATVSRGDTTECTDVEMIASGQDGGAKWLILETRALFQFQVLDDSRATVPRTAGARCIGSPGACLCINEALGASSWTFGGAPASSLKRIVASK
jgi:hypothetical protein